MSWFRHSSHGGRDRVAGFDVFAAAGAVEAGVQALKHQGRGAAARVELIDRLARIHYLAPLLPVRPRALAVCIPDEDPR